MPSFGPLAEAAARGLEEKVPILWDGKLTQVVKNGLEHQRWLKGLNPFEKVETGGLPPMGSGGGGAPAPPSPPPGTPPPGGPRPGAPVPPPPPPSGPPKLVPQPQLGRTLTPFDALTQPAIPPLEERGTAAAPQIFNDAWKVGQPIRKLGGAEYDSPDVDRRVEDLVNKTYDPKTTFAEKLRDAKTTFLSFFNHAPNMPKDINQTLLEARDSRAAAETIANRDIAEQLRPVMGSNSPQDKALAPQKFATIAKHLVLGDIVAQADRDGAKQVSGVPIEDLKRALEQYANKINADPGSRQASVNVRAGLDELFQNMVDEGLIDKERYLDSYSFRQKINAVVGSLAGARGVDENSFRTRILAQTKAREGGHAGITESNVIHLLTAARAQFYKLKSDRELATRLFSDPTLEFSRGMKAGDTLPHGLVQYTPGPGDFGYDPKLHDPKINEAMRKLDPKGSTRTLGYVIPKALAEQLEHYNNEHVSPVAERLLNSSRALSKIYTVYNTANTNLNRISDAMLAIMGMPGEKADPIGFLRFYGHGMKAAKAYVNGNRYEMKINGQTIDVTDLVAKEGVGDATFQKFLSGFKASPELSKYLPNEIEQPGLSGGVLRKLEDSRATVELTPRIAAGLAALEKTGKVKEFGRVGRNITLNFSGGRPVAAEIPLVKFISPFITFTGLAAERTIKLLGSEGSRTRTIAALVAFPTAATAWNNHNDEFKAIEQSIAERDRDQLHVIVSEWGDINKPMRDKEGKPVVLRIRYFVPEEMAKMVGLGNLIGRTQNRANDGENYPIAFAKEAAQAPSKAVENARQLLFTLPDILSGKDNKREPHTLPDKVANTLRVVPQGRLLVDTAQAYADQSNYADGIKEAAKTAAARMLGISTMNTVQTRLGGERVARLVELGQKLQIAQQNMQLAQLQDPSLYEARQQEFFRLRDEYYNLAKQVAPNAQMPPSVSQVNVDDPTFSEFRPRSGPNGPNPNPPEPQESDLDRSMREYQQSTGRRPYGSSREPQSDESDLDKAIREYQQSNGRKPYGVRPH